MSSTTFARQARAYVKGTYGWESTLGVATDCVERLRSSVREKGYTYHEYNETCKSGH